MHSKGFTVFVFSHSLIQKCINGKISIDRQAGSIEQGANHLPPNIWHQSVGREVSDGVGGVLSVLHFNWPLGRPKKGHFIHTPINTFKHAKLPAIRRSIFQY